MLRALVVKGRYALSLVRKQLFFTAVIASLLAFGACNGGDRLPRASGAGAGSGSGGDTSGGGVFNPGTGGDCTDSLCGSEVHEVVYDAPNLYFVIDRSGSMGSPTNNGQTRYKVVRQAALDLVNSLGALINVGAALFPHGAVETAPCNKGSEVLPLTAGLPAGSNGGDSPVAFQLRQVTNVEPLGGTPIAATLQGLTPTLTALSGRTMVMLLTDGGPNCNGAASCGVGECMPNIDGSCLPSENCCAPGYPQGGPLLCLDRDPTLTALEALHAGGVEVYVIGIPGSELYGGLLDEMAEAGGTAQLSGATKYHQVADLDQLGAVLGAIAAEAINCEFPLGDPPDDKGFTNVYLDCELLPYDPVDGWGWIEDDTVWLHGDACQRLKEGLVAQVQVVTGCPTELPQ